MPLPVIATGNASVSILSKSEARTRFHLDICLQRRQSNSAGMDYRCSWSHSLHLTSTRTQRCRKVFGKWIKPVGGTNLDAAAVARLLTIFRQPTVALA